MGPRTILSTAYAYAYPFFTKIVDTVQPKHEMALGYFLAFEEKYPLYLVDIGDADLAVRYKQGKGVPIVFIHGSWDDHHLWMSDAARLACSVRNPILLYDRRGHSASTPDKEQGSVFQDVKDALLLLKYFNFSKAHFVGHSYGATIAIQLTTEYSERVESLFIYEPPIKRDLRI